MSVLTRLLRQALLPSDARDESATALQAQLPGHAARMALSDADEASRIAAIASLDAGVVLLAIAGLSDDLAVPESVRRAAQRRLGELLDAGAVTLADLGHDPAHAGARVAAVACAKDEALLPLALAAIDDEELLGELAIGGASPVARQCAAERLQDPATIGRLLKEARGGDKNVYRILKAKRDAFLAQERAAAQALVDIATLCTAIEEHVHQPCNDAYVAVLDQLGARWDELAGRAPVELRLRAEAALDRCRGVVAAHRQRAADAAARVAAVEQAPARRRALLQELKDVLAGAYAATIGDLDGPVAEITRRWQELSAIRPPGPEESAGFRDLGEAIASVGAFNARHGSVEAQAGMVSAGNVAELAEALRHLRWLEGNTPAPARAAAAAVQAWQQARDAQREAEAAALRQVSGLLRKAQGALTAGHSRQAAGLRRAIEEKLHQVPAVPQRLASQLQALDAQLVALEDWRSYAVAPKRAELIAAMEALVGSTEAPRLLADQIHQLQEDWKLISRGSTEDTAAEWQRFHAAAERAYEPCRQYFEAQAEVRAGNLERRRALLARLQTFATAQDPEQPDWREIARALRESRQQWRSLEPVDRAANRPLQAAFDALAGELRSRLEAEYARNAELKRALIGRAQQLAALDDARQATDEAKRLQAAWEDLGAAAPDENQRLWEEFRRHCDTVFAKRQQQHDELQARLAGNVSRAAALCDAADQVAALAGPELVEGVKTLAGIRHALAAVGELPPAQERALRTRFERAVEQCERRLKQQRALEKAQAWDRVLEAGDRIRRYRLAVAEAATPEEREARRAEAGAFIDGTSSWPKGALQALQAALAGEGSPDLGVNEAALRTLCIRAELLTDSPTPEEDQALRRDWQMQQLLKGLGQARVPVREELERMVLEWLAVGATADAVHASLLGRFRNCRQRAARQGSPAA